MKKLLFTLLIGITALAYSQAPQKISYQGVARNASGTVLANQPISIRFDIHQSSASGSIVFTETHTPVTTNNFGLFTTYIGSISNLGVVNWASGPYFIEVWIDPNTGTFSSLGSQQLMSVPYALNAGSAPAPAVSFTNNILSVGGNTTTISAGTTYTAGTGISLTGSTITNIAPDQTITITPAGSASVTGTYPNFIISTPIVQAYTAGNGIDINGTGVITGTANIVGTGATSVTGTYPNLTINTPSVAPDQTVTITGINSATVTGSYPNFTVNVPNGSSLPNALSGQFLYNTGTVWDTLPRNNLYFDGTNFGIGTTSPQANFHVVGAGRFDASVSTPHVFTNTLTVSGGTLGQVLTSDGSGNGTFQNLPVAQTPTITSTGIAVVTPTTGNTFNVDVPVPVLNYNNINNVLTLTQGTVTTSDTLTGTGSSTISIASAGIASVSPTSGSAFTVSVASPTFTPNGPTTITGSYPNLTINSTATPSTSLVAGNLNLTLFPSGNTYTLDVKSYSLTANSNTLTLSNGASITTATVPTSSLTTIAQGSNVTVAGSAPSYTVSAPAYSITLPGGNVVQITNGVSTSTAPIAATNLTLNGVNNNILSAGGNTVALNTYSAGTGISVTGTAPNFTISNTSPAVTPTITGTGVATVNNVSPNYTVNVPMSIYNNNTGVFTTGTQTIAVTPTLSLTGTTLTSGPPTNSVNLSGFNGIYGGSGSIQTGSTTVTVGTNTLTFLSGNTANKPIANFFGGGITGTSMTLGHVGANAANFKFVGSATTTPVDYGYVSGGANGIAISGGTSSNGLYATTNAEIGVGTFTTGTGKFVITHSASQAIPTMHLRETSGALSRIKFSNTGVANKYFEVGASNNAANNFSAYSVSFFDGTNYKSRFLIYGDGKTSINNMHSALTTFHVMDDNVTSPGIAAEGFGFSGQINLTRNNPLGVSPTYTRGAVIAAQEIGKINFSAYDGTGYGDGAKIYARASENVTNTSKGTDLFFAVVPNTTNSNQELLKLGNDGIVTVNPNNIFNKAALDVKGRLRVDSSLTMTAYNTPPNNSFVNEGRIYYDRPSNKFKVSENGGAYVDLISGAGLSPWTQGASIVTLSNINDKVGIGTNAPQSPLHIANAAGSQLRLGNFNQPSYEWIWDVDATSNLSLVNENNGTAITRLFMDVNTGKLGLGTSSPNALLDVVNVSNSNAISASSSGTVEALSAKNTNASVLAYAGSFDGGIYSKGKTSSTSGFSFRAVNSSSTELFNVRNDGNVGINVTNPGYRLAVSENSSTLSAIYATNTSATSSSSAHGVSGLTSNTHSLAAGVYGNNSSVGPSIYAEKNATQTGIAGRFEILNTTNTADVIFSSTSGSGAAVHAVNSAANLSSALSLWVENGHIKATGTNATSSTTVTSISTSTVIGNDVVGKISITTVATAIPANQEMIKVQFAKSYPAGVTPNIIITPSNANAAGVQGYVSTVSNSGFSIFFNVGTAAIIRTYTFNYMVIE